MAEETQETKKPEDAGKGSPEEKSNKGNKTLLIVELIIAAVAVIFIIVAIALNTKKNNGDPTASANTVATGTPTETSGDFSSLYDNVPAAPLPDEYNPITEAEAATREADGSLLKVTAADGSFAYVNNYLDQARFRSETEVTAEEMDDYINSYILADQGETVPTDHETAQMYDTVSINYAGSIEEIAFEGGTANDQVLTIGISAYIPGFSEGIIGMAPGETKDVNVTFPENYGNTDLAGKDAVFSITLNEIVGEYKQAELTDEFIAEYTGGEINNVDEFMSELKKNMAMEKIWNYLDVDFYVSSLPEGLLRSYYDSAMQQYEAMSTAYGISIDDLLSGSGMTVDDLKSAVMDEAAQEARYARLYQIIAETNNISVTEEDVATLAADYGYAEDIPGFKEYYGEAIINNYLLQTKIMEYMMTLR